MESEIKRQLAGHDPKTGEDLDIHVSKKIQVICNLCGIPSCRHIVSLPQEDFPYIVGEAFPSWKRKYYDWIWNNRLPILFMDAVGGICAVSYVVWWNLK